MKKRFSTTIDKAKTMTLWWEGIAIKDFGVRTGFTVRTIKRVNLANRNLPESSIRIRKKGSGSPKKTSKSTDRLLKCTVLKNPMMTAKEIKEVMALELGNVSVYTIQHRL
jgi:transposase